MLWKSAAFPAVCQGPGTPLPWKLIPAPFEHTLLFNTVLLPPFKTEKEQKLIDYKEDEKILIPLRQKETLRCTFECGWQKWAGTQSPKDGQGV